jgi:hypothetical protein
MHPTLLFYFVYTGLFYSSRGCIWCDKKVSFSKMMITYNMYEEVLETVIVL